MKKHVMMAVLILLVFSGFADDIKRVQDFDLNGSVSTVTTSRRLFQLKNGVYLRQPSYTQQKLQFDELGRLTSMTRYGYLGNKSNFTSHEYDSFGRLAGTVFETFNYAGETTGRTETSHTYTSTGAKLLVQSTRFSNDGDLISITETYYSDSGAVTERVTMNANKRITHHFTDESTDEGRIINTKEFNKFGVLTSRETTLYNPSGNIVREERWATKAGTSRWMYTYDNVGNLTELTYENRSRKTDSWSFSYDEERRMVGVRRFDEQGELVADRTFQYNGNGNLRSQIAILTNHGITSTWRYVYDDKERIVEEVYFYEPYGFTVTQSQLHGDEPKRHEREIVDTFGESFYRHVTEHDSRDVLSFNEETTKGTTTGYRLTETYDSSDRKLTSYRYSLHGTMISGNRYAYTDFGDLAESYVLNSDMSIRTKESYVYRYDDFGNWTFKKKLNTDNLIENYDAPEEEQTRRITYH